MKRKNVSSAFYKDKLIKMVEIMKVSVKESLERVKKTYVDTGKEMNLVGEMFEIEFKALLDSSFGEDISGIELDY